MASTVPLPMPPREELVRLYEDEKLSYPQICEIYNISAATLSKWMKLLKIETRGKAYIKVIGGVKHRRCYGSLHQGEFVPMNKFWKDRVKPLGTHSRCVDCMKIPQQVAFSPTMQAWVKSIVNRLGMMETCRRLGISNRTLKTWLGEDRNRIKPLHLKRHHAISIVTVLGELRFTGEVRHRKSIRRGATARGEKERVPTRMSEFYSGGGDAATEARQANRQANAEREREYNKNYRERRKQKKESGLTDRKAA